MITSMILRRSEDLWSHGISVFPRRAVRFDVLRRTEQFGAHLQPCPVGCIQVDGKPNMAVFERELDHSPASMNRSISATVSTLDPRKPARIWGSRFFSEAL